MRIDYVHIKNEFKNLKDFKVDLPEDSANPVIVLLGPNATGKSNFIEALVLIFKYLDLDEKPPFEYEIGYERGGKHIKIQYEHGKYVYEVDQVLLKSKKEFERRKEELLPKYVFTYYSGVSNRLEKIFWDHQNRFYNKIKQPGTTKDDVNGLRRLFYVQLIHSLFVLLAYYYEEDDNTQRFLREELKIDDLESVLFVLRKPRWKGKGDPRFWGAEGLVQEFLSELWRYSTAPIKHTENTQKDFRGTEDQERLYLYISNKDKLKQLAGYYGKNTDFFKALESTYISDLIEEVRVKVKKQNVEGKITFRELSEGEQQLLTVLGLLKFTNDEESLVLLDEPDTHLNPIWKWKYLEYLDKVVKRSESTQIILNTHDPLLIGSLKKEQIRLFRRNEDGKVYVEHPGVDPQGLGVAGILTSELFGLPTTLDKETQTILNRKRSLQGQLMGDDELNESEKNELRVLTELLEEKGFYDITTDQTYNQFLHQYSQHPLFKKVELSANEKADLELVRKEILEKIIQNQEDEAHRF